MIHVLSSLCDWRKSRNMSRCIGRQSQLALNKSKWEMSPPDPTCSAYTNNGIHLWFFTRKAKLVRETEHIHYFYKIIYSTFHHYSACIKNWGITGIDMSLWFGYYFYNTRSRFYLNLGLNFYSRDYCSSDIRWRHYQNFSSFSFTGHQLISFLCFLKAFSHINQKWR